MLRLKNYVVPLLQVITFAFLLWLTILPVEVRWSDADGILSNTLPALSVAGVLCFLFTKGGGRLTIVDGLVALWSLYYVGRVWFGAEYPCGTEWLQAMEIVVLYVVLRMVLHNTKIPAWGLCAGIVLFACYEAMIGAGQLISGNGRHHIFVLTGTFQNPGPYSAYLMIAGSIVLCRVPFTIYHLQAHFPHLFSGIYHLSLANRWARRFWKNERMKSIVKETVYYSLSVIAFLPLLILPATWSRAAFVGMGVCALWIFKKRYWRFRWYVWGALVAVAVAFYFIKRGSADGRSLIWMASLTTWMHDMWLGVGVGGFRHACAEGIAEMWNANHDSAKFASAGVTDYAYNAMVKILVEQGLVGALLWITITLLAMWRLYKLSVSLFMGMLSLLVFSMFSYPFELLPYRIIAVMVFAWSESRDKSTLCLHLNKIICTFVSIITIAFSWFLKTEITERIEHDKDATLFAGMRNSAFLSDYYELLPYETDNPQYLFDFAKTLREETRYEDSNAILRMGTQVSADPMFYIIMGNNYRDEQLYDLAKETYEKAYSIMPNRLYPMYLLMMMYADKGDEALANDMAKRVRHSYVKIESNATKQMQEKADSILGKR